MSGHQTAGVTFVHLARRARGLTPPAFQLAWLGVDIRAIAGLRGLLRYGQNHALLRGYEKGELLFDGIEEYRFMDAGSFAAAMASDAWAGLRKAGDAHVDRSASLEAVVDVSVQKDGAPPEGAVRSTEFVNRRADMAVDDFRRYWARRHGPLASDIPQVIRYEQHHLADRDYAAGAPRFDGWAATWFADTAAMRESAKEPVYEATRADEVNFLAGPLPVLFTRERLVVLGA